MMRPQSQSRLSVLVAICVGLAGCLVHNPPCVPPSELDHYKELAATTPLGVDDPHHIHGAIATAPILVDPDKPPPPRNLTLEETVQIALTNSKVLRELGGTILRAPNAIQTIHNPAIQATDPRFGMEGALAAFDAEVSTRLFFQNNDRAINNRFLGGGTFLLQQDRADFQTEISKRTASGTAFALRHNVDYDANNAPQNLFPSAWNANVEAEFRQPFMRGAGTDFNRIAGPGAIPGVINGVLIARVNTDISAADFELALRDFVSNLENAYWDLYYAYRELDALIAARNAALDTWRGMEAGFREGRVDAWQEAQAREQYFRFQEAVVDALGGRPIERTRTFNGSGGGTFRGVGGVHAAERRLRLLMGLPISDGHLLRPVDEPPAVKVDFDWDQIVVEALARRPELRRQQFLIERRRMEVAANKNFLLPQLDMIGRYRWRGFGDDLLDPSGDGMTPFDNAYENLTSGDFQEWELGLEYNMPLGFRRGYAAVHQAELLLARELAILKEQERQAVHDLSAVYAELQRAFINTQTAYNRRNAALQQLRSALAAFEQAGRVSLEIVLDAQGRLADADAGYHRARVEYALALKNLHFEKGSLLEYEGVHLAGGVPWHEKQLALGSQLADDAKRLNYVRTPQPGESPAAEAGQEPSAPATGAARPVIQASFQEPSPETAHLRPQPLVPSASPTSPDLDSVSPTPAPHPPVQPSAASVPPFSAPQQMPSGSAPH